MTTLARTPTARQQREAKDTALGWRWAEPGEFDKQDDALFETLARLIELYDGAEEWPRWFGGELVARVLIWQIRKRAEEAQRRGPAGRPVTAAFTDHSLTDTARSRQFVVFDGKASTSDNGSLDPERLRQRYLGRVMLGSIRPLRRRAARGRRRHAARSRLVVTGADPPEPPSAADRNGHPRSRLCAGAGWKFRS